ncbi:hypothetical protein [Halomonas cupida]
MAAQGRAAVGHQADARPQDENQINQDELFDCHVNSTRASARFAQA